MEGTEIRKRRAKENKGIMGKRERTEKLGGKGAINHWLGKKQECCWGD